MDMTAKQEQEKFEELLSLVSGGKIRPESLKNISCAISERLEDLKDDDEIVTLDARELQTIFEESGIRDLGGFEEAFEQTVGSGFEFKATSLAGSGLRSVSISTGVSDINISMEDLVSVRQTINARGRKCLEIELSDDAEINGISLETEGA
jgi:hypothetical protein